MDFQSIALPSELRYLLDFGLWTLDFGLWTLDFFLLKKIPISYDEDSLKKGDDILSHKIAVPSALAGLTTLFGMGRGEPRRNNHLKVVSLKSKVLKSKVYFETCDFRLWTARVELIS